MRALSLDYRRNDNPSQHRLGVAVLVLALAACALLGLYYRKIAGEDARLAALVAKIDHKLHPANSAAKLSPAKAQQAGAEIKAANEVMLQLNLPWGEMFAALEGANNNGIALLGIEPDARKGLVRVSGEAKTFEALFAYIRRLQESKSMSAVYLKHHQIQEQDPDRPIRFTLDASWTLNS